MLMTKEDEALTSTNDNILNTTDLSSLYSTEVTNQTVSLGANVTGAATNATEAVTNATVIYLLNQFNTEYRQIHGSLSLSVCVFGIIANVLNIIVLTR